MSFLATNTSFQWILEHGRTGFTDIPRAIASVMAAHRPHALGELGDVLDADAWARDQVRHAAAGGFH